MAKHTFKILRCEHHKISKACLTIFRHYACKSFTKLNIYSFDDNFQSFYAYFKQTDGTITSANSKRTSFKSSRSEAF